MKNIPKYLITKDFRFHPLNIFNADQHQGKCQRKICQWILEKWNQKPSFSKFVNSETNLIRYSEKHISHTTLVKYVLNTKSEKMMIFPYHQGGFQILLWKMVKEWSRPFCNIFFFFGLFFTAETFREYKSANNSTLQDRDAQKTTFWDVIHFCLNNSRLLKVRIWLSPSCSQGVSISWDMNGEVESHY